MSSEPSLDDSDPTSLAKVKEDEQALILFDLDLMKRMQSTHRLPGTYVGVRRIRPSSKQVQRAHVAKKQGFVVPPPPPFVFKVVDPQTGQERRMNAVEKKAAKQERMRLRQLQIQQAKAQQKQKEEPTEKECNAQTQDKLLDEEEKLESSLESRVVQHDASNQTSSSEGQEKYYYFKINKTSLEQELADLRGDRSGVPPILLSPGQAHIAKSLLASGGVNASDRENIRMDDMFAQEWACALRASMMPAIQTRKSEAMRGMVYDIIPQLWTRLKPAFAGNKESPPKDMCSTAASHNNHLTLPCAIRPALSIDREWNVLMEALYQGTGIHIGCGAKFGCDILLYDGPRSQRHAFAGLRLVQPTKGTRFPLPRAYDMAGYVRCLNTAGKLALLATVQQDDDGRGYSVSIIDLALEKIDVQRKPKPSKTLEDRMEKLAKAVQ